MVQVLHLSNGKTLNDNLRNAKSSVTPLVERDNAALIEEAYLLCLARARPAPRKPSASKPCCATAAERRAVIEDLFWALMTLNDETSSSLLFSTHRHPPPRPRRIFIRTSRRSCASTALNAITTTNLTAIFRRNI